MASNTLKFSLIENANSFLIEALRGATEAEFDSLRWKFAIFHLVQSIELALKERLRREHPAFILLNIDRVDGPKKSPMTVTLGQAISRLRSVSGIFISEQDLKAVERAQSWRNDIAHHEFQGQSQELKASFAQLLGFLQEFYRKHLSMTLSRIVPEHLWNEATQIFDYYEELKRRAATQIVDEGIASDLVWGCPRCGANTFVAADSINTCYTCAHRESTAPCYRCGKVHFVVQLVFFYDEGTTMSEGICSDCMEEMEHDPAAWYDDPALT